MLEIGQEIAYFAGMDTVQDIDADGLPVYQFGHRRTDGVWISPRGWYEPPAMYVRLSSSGCTRKPMYLYGDDLQVRS